MAAGAGEGADTNGQRHRCQPDWRMDEFADSRCPHESALLAVWAGIVLAGEQAQHGQVPAGVVLSDRGEPEISQGECGVEAGRGKVVHEGPWVVMES